MNNVRRGVTSDVPQAAQPSPSTANKPATPVPLNSFSNDRLRCWLRIVYTSAAMAKPCTTETANSVIASAENGDENIPE